MTTEPAEQALFLSVSPPVNTDLKSLATRFKSSLQIAASTRVKLGTPSDTVKNLLNMYSSGEANRYEALQTLKKDIEPYLPIFTLVSEYMIKLKTPEETLARAIVNQQMGQDFFELLHRPAGHPAWESCRFLQDFADALATAEGGYQQFGQAIKALLSGGKTQGALMFLFEKQGYDNWAPPITKPQQVASCDRDAGVDFVAIAPEKDFLLFVDSKGKARYELNKVDEVKREIPAVYAS